VFTLLPAKLCVTLYKICTGHNVFNLYLHNFSTREHVAKKLKQMLLLVKLKLKRCFVGVDTPSLSVSAFRNATSGKV
jgi:hypothetical protein